MNDSIEPYDLFISYSRSDDKDFVKQLYEDLTKQEYKAWYDLESLESNGLSFLQSIRDALAVNPIRLILVVSPQTLESEFVAAEWKFALENCQVIIPVLRMGLEKNLKGEPIASDRDYELVPEPLLKRRLHCIDFRRERNYNDAFKELLYSLSKDVKKLTTLHGVSNKPANYIERQDEIEAIKQLVLKDSFHPTVVTSAGKATAVQGMGGIGKSVIAAAVCHDCDIRRSFDDGIYWVTLGQKPDIEKALQYITKDDTINLRDNYEEAKDKLKVFLKDKTCLIVLDDVWQQEHVEMFSSDTALRSRLLITTRNKQTIRHLSSDTFEIGLLSKEDGFLLLSKTSNKKFEELPNEATEIVDECGNLPLAISMIGGMIKAGDEYTWKHSLTMLQEADLEVISQKFPDYPYPDLFKAIDISVNSLSEEIRTKYLELGIFKEDTRIPEEIIHVLWKTGNWKEYHTHQLLNNFVERSILQRIDNGIYELHDLQLDYIKKTANNLQVIHLQLLDNLGDPLNLSHHYFWNNYIWHLKEAGKIAKAKLLLQDFDWINAKLFATNAYELLKDYEHFSLDLDSDLIYRALQLSAHVLVEDKNQLPAQITGRLSYFENDAIVQLLEKAKTWKRAGWIKPAKPSLIPPGNLLRVLKAHGLQSFDSSFVHDGKLITASFDNTIRIHDIESGQCLHTLIGHTGKPNMLLVYDNKLISSSTETYGDKVKDSTIRIWDIDSGLCLQILKGHTGAISSIVFQGNKIISGSNDHTIRIWDINSGHCIHILTGHKGRINSLLVRGNKFISGSTDSTIRYWDIESGKCINMIQPPGTGAITLLFIHENYLICESWCHIYVWDAESYQSLYTFQGITRHTTGLSIHDENLNSEPPGSIYITNLLIQKNNLISATYKDIRIWDIKSGKLIHILQDQKYNIRKLLVYKDKLITETDYCLGCIHIWDIVTGECLNTLKRHAKGISSLIIHNDKLISGSWDGSVCIWEIESGTCIQTFNGHRGGITSLMVQGNKLIGEEHSNIFIWEMDSGNFSQIPQGHTDRIELLEVYNNNIITGSRDHTIRIWQKESGNCKHKLQGHIESISLLLVHENKIYSVSANNDIQFKRLSDPSIYIWDIGTGKSLDVLKGHTGGISSLLIHNDKLISGSWDKTIRIWDINSRKCLHVLQSHTGYISYLLIHNNKLISGSADRTIWTPNDSTIRIWHLESGELLHVLEGLTGGIMELLVYDNKIICKGHHGVIRVWDIESGHSLKTLHDQGSELIIYNNKLITSSCWIWDIETGKCLQTLQKFRLLLIHRNHLIGESDDYKHSIPIKNMEGELLQKLDGHKGAIVSLVVHNDKFISTDSSGLLLVHDVNNFAQLSKYYADAGFTTKIVVDNNRIISGDNSGQLHILEMMEV